MSKKLNIMSLSIEPELHDLLKEHARKKSMSVSEFVRKWLDKYPFNTDNVIPVVIDIPDHAVRDKAVMEEFLRKKCQVISRALCG
jgi:hypothetical protein